MIKIIGDVISSFFSSWQLVVSALIFLIVFPLVFIIASLKPRKKVVRHNFSPKKDPPSEKKPDKETKKEPEYIDDELV